MLPRNRSIFHLGEESHEREQNTINGVTEAREGPVIGLRALIQHQEKESKVTVVIKSSMKPSKKPPPPDGCRILSANFLKFCFFCKNELSLQKEVYMYRGDQGFCSVECRCKQILLDERRDQIDASKREHFRVPYQHAGSKVQVSSRRTKIHIAF